jgi:Zn-finger nucleic acid-binding protein
MSGEVVMNCPRCSLSMECATVEGQDLLLCRSCGGIWAHRHQLNHMLKETSGDAESCSIDEDSHDDGKPGLICISCGDVPMRKISFMDYSDIIMDWCPACGSMFFDREELKRMHGYLKAVEEGSHSVKDFSAFNILRRMSEIAWRIFH